MNEERLNREKRGGFEIQAPREGEMFSPDTQKQMCRANTREQEGRSNRRIKKGFQKIPPQNRRQSHSRRLTMSHKLICVILLVACVLVVKKVLDITATRTARSSTIITSPGSPGTEEGRVMGIMISPAKVSAIVGSKLVHEGDMLGDVEIRKIEEGRVYFEKCGIQWSQTLQDPPAPHWK